MFKAGGRGMYFLNASTGSQYVDTSMVSITSVEALEGTVDEI